MSKTKGKVDDNHQNNSTDDASNWRINMYCDCSKGARGKDNNTNDNGGLSHGLCLDFKDQFHLPQAKIGEKNCKKVSSRSVGEGLM